MPLFINLTTRPAWTALSKISKVTSCSTPYLKSMVAHILSSPGRCFCPLIRWIVAKIRLIFSSSTSSVFSSLWLLTGDLCFLERGIADGCILHTLLRSLQSFISFKAHPFVAHAYIGSLVVDLPFAVVLPVMAAQVSKKRKVCIRFDLPCCFCYRDNYLFMCVKQTDFETITIAM